LADFGVTGGAGRGVGDLLGSVSVLEPGAVSVLDEVFVLGMAPEVVAVGKDGVILGLEDWFEEVVDEGNLARAEVLALGGLKVGTGAGAGALAIALGAGALILNTDGCCGCSEKYPSAVSMVYQLNLNSPTVSGSPVRSR
jgi:hypothetical protein